MKVDLIVKLILCHVIHFVLGIAALVITFFCCAAMIALQTNCETQNILSALLAMGEPELLDSIRSIYLENIPLGAIVEQIFEAGDFSISMLSGMIKGEGFTLLDLFLDLIAATVAGTIICIFCKLNKWLSSMFSGILLKITFKIVLLIWAFCGFGITFLILYTIDAMLPIPEARMIAKVTLFVISLLIHAWLLADGSLTKRFIKVPFIILLKKLPSDFLSSLVIACFSYSLHGLYDYSHFGGFMLVSVIAVCVFALQCHQNTEKDKRLGIL